MREDVKLETAAIHAGETERILGAAVFPIFQSAMYEYMGETSYHDLKYIRLNNTPNHVVLSKKLAALEQAEAALVTSSGMAAISTALLTVLKPGDHILMQDCLYGGTHDFVTKDLPEFNIHNSFVDGSKPETWEQSIRPNTKAFYVESITNPTMQVIDLGAVVDLARRHNLVSMIDNTFATPLNFQPIANGFDISLHSATKYLNGHSDIVAGVAIGTAAMMEQITHRLNHFGGSLDPHACFLLNRGLKTLAVRIRQQNINALKLAGFLAERSEVGRVNYPGLESHSSRTNAKRYLSGFGGMLSFDLKGGTQAADQLMKALTIPIKAPSLGGPETLVTRPAQTSHAGLSQEERGKSGISESLIRVSVGLEEITDLLEDFDQALNRLH